MHKERQATSVPVVIHASRVSPSKADLEAAMQKLSIDTAMALRMKDEQARAALIAQKASFEQTAQNWSRAAKDAVSVEVAQAKNDEKNRASRMLNAEMHEERRVGELTMRTAEQLIKEEAEATLHMTKMNLQKEAESFVMEQAERLQSIAKNEVTEARERALTVNTHKDEMTEEQNVAMNMLQYKVQQMEMNEMHHREEAQQQLLRMQKVYDEQQAMLQEQLSTKYDAMFAESERRYEAKISHAACSLQAAVEENRSLKVKMVDEHF